MDPRRFGLLALATLLAGCTSDDLYVKWESADAIEAFRAAGLEAESTTTMTPPDYGDAPTIPREGTRFLIPSLCADCGGRAMSFDSREDRDAMHAYYVDLGKADERSFSWAFAFDNLVLQINGDLPEAQARAYERALANVSS